MGAGIRRACTVRAALTLAVMALPLCAASAAQASIAGGNPSTTTQLPDLRSATATSGSDVQVCFDKPLSQSSAVVSHPTDIYLDGYASGSNYLDPVAANIDSKNGDCVDLVFNAENGALDLGQFTAATVENGAVETTGGQVNLADSTTLLSSNTHNGTAGLTDAPDLVGPAPVAYSSSTPNTIEYVFDQSVDPASIDPTKFYFEDANGNYCYGSSGEYSEPDVYITFTAAGSNGAGGKCASNDDVLNARRAGLLAGGVTDVSSDEIPNPPQGTSMPNNAGTTTDADLISAVLDSSGNQVTYTFDKPVNAGTASDFFVALANGQVIDGTSTSAASPDAITVTFNVNGGTSDTNLANYDEYAVQAGIDNPAAASTSSTTPARPASLGTVPIGGNSGAFARGFTTGPDAYALTFNPTQDTATIYFDQRVADYCQDENTLAACDNSPSSSSDYYIDVLNGAGSVLGPPSSVVVPAFPNPGPEAVTMDVDPAIFAQSPTQVALGRDAFGTALPETIGDDDDNVPQIIAATATSAHLRPLALTRARHRGHRRRRGGKARRAHRARRARTRT